MDKTNQFSQKDIQENKGISFWAYFGLLFIVPYFAASDSPFAQFHARQGFALMLRELILILFIFISNLISSFVSIFSLVTLILEVLFFDFVWFFTIYGVVNTLKGNAKILPLIGPKK